MVSLPLQLVAGGKRYNLGDIYFPESNLLFSFYLLTVFAIILSYPRAGGCLETIDLLNYLILVSPISHFLVSLISDEQRILSFPVFETAPGTP